MKNIALFAFLIFISLHGASAQILKDIKKAAVDVGKGLNTKENREKVGKMVVSDLEKARAEFDSTDFDYAILLSDNSGLFDIKEKGEARARITSLSGTISSMYKNMELSDAEEARFNLDMGEILYANQKYAMAEKRFAAARSAYDRAGLGADIGNIKTIANQGLLYATMGRFTQAEGYTAEALDIRKEKFGDQNVSVAVSLNNYAVLKYNLARYNEAEKDFESALAILKNAGLGAEIPGSIVLNNQAMLYQTIGRLDAAEKILKEAIAIAENFQKSKSRNHLKFLSNLALLYQQQGKYTEAEAIYLGMEKRLGKTNPDYGSMLNNQAALYVSMGKDDKVKDLLKRSIAIYKSNFGEENPAFAKSTSDLGNFYRYKGRYAEAEPLLMRALAIRESTLGKNHPLWVQSREDIAILHWKKKDFDRARPVYQEVMEKSLDFINSYFPPMSEVEKTKYWEILSPRFQRYYNFCWDNHSVSSSAGEIFKYHIATKGLLLNTTNKVKQSIFGSKDPQLIKNYLSWLDQKENLARLYAYSKEELKIQKINLDSIERAANAMEKKLSERSPAFSQGYAVQKTNAAQITSLLTDQEAVVELLRVQAFDQKFSKDVKYFAFILMKGQTEPTIIALDNGLELETRYYKYYRNAIQQKIADAYSFNQYWSKIDPLLKARKIIYLSPDGIYNQININTLKSESGDFLVNRFDVVIVGNSKDVISLKARKPRTPKKNAVLLGFPEYGSSEVTPLPGTKLELQEINTLLKSSGYQIVQYQQKTATESNIKSLKAPMLVHIATHGYFLQDVDETGLAFGVHIENAQNNPLLRSGLILAGGGQTVSGSRVPSLTSNDNGILTAYEAMNLNLEGTDLIVLSACETGLGDVRAGEGVYGLQRAFLVAGADAMIMSLWKVDDAATQQLMTNFYTNWIKGGNKQKAFKQAQQQLMTKYKDPYFWGAFVMLGL